MLLTFRRSIVLRSDGINFAINVGRLQSHLTTRLSFCDVTIVPTHDEMTSHAARWPTSLSCVSYPYMVGEGFRVAVMRLAFWVPPQNWVSWSINDDRWTAAYQRWQLTKIERFNCTLMKMVKVKQSLCWSKRHAMNIHGRVKVRLQAFTTWALDGL